MRALCLVAFCLVGSFLYSVNLLNEQFASSSYPTGWTATGPMPSAWTVSSTTNAGGTANELKLSYSPSATGTYRFISPAIDTRKAYNMTLSFKHSLNDYVGNTNSYYIGVLLSHDLNTWVGLWAMNVNSSIPATEQIVDIPYQMGMSQTTYIAFWFSGNNYDINSWSIDDVVLSYTDTLGSGTWAAGTYYPGGDIYVPAGHTFTLSPGSALYFETDRFLDVQGSFKAMGQFGLPVILSAMESGSTWRGIKLMSTGSAQDSTIIDYTLIEKSNDSALTVSNSNKIRVSNSFIMNNTCYPFWAVVIMDNTDAIIENCTFRQNGGSGAPVLWDVYGGAKIRNNTFDQNEIPDDGAAVVLQNTSLDNFTGNSFTRNTNYSGSGYALHLVDCSGTLYRQKIANNISNGVRVSGTVSTPYITNCLIVNNHTKGLVVAGNAALRNTIIWGNGTGSIQNSQTALTVRYCCIAGGSGGISGTAIPGANYTNNISSNPLFVNPSTDPMDFGDPTLRDWRLNLASPCIDAGDPSHLVDPDGSIVDIGMYSRRLKPFISRASDLPADQGHQLDLVWLPNELDTEYQADWCYTVWREGGYRDDACVISSLMELPAAIASKAQYIGWQDGNRTWYYLAQVPVVGFPDYGLIVPTLQDSSSTGSHAANYMVVYHNPSNIWMSVPKSGYSVDNIPPMSPRTLDLQHLGGALYSLAWEDVTEGIWEGNSYPEINQVRYKVYASQDPIVPIIPQNLIGTTTSPQLLINSAADKRFFRVVAFDTE